MFDHIKMQNLDDVFLPLDARQPRGVYFYRINGFREEVSRFIRRYYETARRSGVVIEGKIPNPDEKNLAYYNEMMGMDFTMDTEFIASGLKKWIPRMDDYQRGQVAAALYGTLCQLQKTGKTGPMLKNAYIKFMCWLYYKFERIVNQLGGQEVPKILYEGSISNYELLMLSILSNAGCDIILLQYQGDGGYLKLDAGSRLSDAWGPPGMAAFEGQFSLKKLREDIQKEQDRERLYGQPPKRPMCTNAWMGAAQQAQAAAPGQTPVVCPAVPAEGSMEADILSFVKKDPQLRGDSSAFLYNCFGRITGVDDKLAYANTLYQFHLELKNSGRRAVVVNEKIPRPQPDEIAAVHRSSYTRQDQMVMDLSSNIKYPADMELQRLLVKAFVDVLLLAAAKPGMNLNKLTNRAVYLLCWLKRYQEGLFTGWKPPQVGCFFYMGGCRDENEALFMQFLARAPVDVLVFCPNLNQSCCLADSLLYEVHYTGSLDIHTFPQENADVHIGTAAYHAERELDTLMYQDSGIYRNRQYGKANALTLQTMYEEIKILWNEEVKYRPNFSTVDNVVNIPVIFAKVSGVKDGQVSQYWRTVKELVTEDTFVIKKAPFLEPSAPNPVKAHAAEFYRNRKLDKSKIKNHASYQYGFLREEIQDYILEKLQALVDSKIIRGTFENGTEYTIVATVLNLPKDIVRLIQKFDFTKKNPKCIYINTTEAMISLEDSILAAFLNLAGFDVLFFVPTGYQNIEKFFNRKIIEEHQAGEYVYDLRVPNMEGLSPNGRIKWREKLRQLWE